MESLALVIPCFNEADRFRSDVVLAYLATHPSVRLCLVDDGSTDGTRRRLEAIREANAGQIRVLGLDANCGKAEAVRRGVTIMAAESQAGVIGYWDADLSTPLDELETLLDVIRRDGECRLAMGVRLKRLGSRVERRASRHMLGRVFATAAALVLGLPVYDSQCGAKLFRADLVPVVFDEPFMSRWLFDVEILARLRNRYGVDGVLRMVREVPLGTWTDVPGSKVRFGHMLRVPYEFLRIRRRYGRPAGR